jgi:hypothetical protein
MLFGMVAPILILSKSNMPEVMYPNEEYWEKIINENM